MRKTHEAIKVKGIAKLLLRNVKTGKIDGYREVENVITQLGFQQFIVYGIHADLSSAGLKISHGALSSRVAACSSSQTNLIGETTDAREEVTGTLVGDGTCQSVWSYSVSKATDAAGIGNLGLFNSSSEGVLFACASFAVSTKTTDQTLAITYQQRFA